MIPGAPLCSRGLNNGLSPFPLHTVHIDLDGAWPKGSTESYVDCRSWGRRLRYSATREGISQFYDFIREKTARFTLFGSGDYHHLSALWLRRLEEPVTLVSFDNHPDWDIRPPHWCCGTWINRALELPMVRRAVIWGCGNYELNWPANLFVSRKALRTERLQVWPWTERLKNSGRKRWPGMTRENWREKFSDFARRIIGEKIYVTVDLDCLAREEARTNWENGLFKIEDIAWALEELRSQSEIVGGDLCGGYSTPQFERWKQRIESTIDHPALEPMTDAETARRNGRAMQLIWSSLTNGHRLEDAAGALSQQAKAL
jgi:arginase family enzyme